MASNANSFQSIRPALSELALTALAQAFGFAQATPVQAAAIPLFLSNKDVLVEAVTGSGKTLAFGLPILEILHAKFQSKRSKYDVGALVVAPTRELAAQIADVFRKFMPFYPDLRHCLFVGGQPVVECVAEYEKLGGHIVIGTPGRILDMQHRCDIINFKTLEVLVMDEADTLLDMGFRDSINQILSFLPKQRRTGLFSATQTKEVKELARAGMRNPVSISVKVQSNNKNPTMKGENIDGKARESLTSPDTGLSSYAQQSIPNTLKNNFLVCEYEERPRLLANFIRLHKDEKIIVFCATCACVDFYSSIFYELSKDNEQNYFPQKHPIIGFHGKMVPLKRNALYSKFVGLSAGVMFTTDVAARGIDIPDVNWILQIAAPKDPAFFVHRIGRTARAGRAGGALLFIAPHEDTYVELIKGRGVPLVELDKSELQTQYNNDDCNNINNSSTSNNDSSINKRLPPCPFLADLKKLVMEDRALLEAGTNAFISFLRAYKENLCSYIFRLDQLDIGSVARAYALLKLPKIPETQSQRKGSKKPVDFEATDVNTGTIPFKHKEREDARQRKYKEKLEAEKEERENGPKVVAKSSVGNSNTTKPNKKDASEDDPNNKKRKRKKKQSFTQKLKEEWDDLAAEEAAFRKFKRGKLSRVAYEGCLMDADANADAINTLMDTKGTSKKSKKRKTSRKYDSDDNSDDDDSDDDGSESD